MKTSGKIRVGVAFVLMALAACSVDKEGKNNEIHTDTLVFASNPEPVDGRLDVYETMARASKYNVDVAARNLSKKIYNQNPNLKPDEIIENIISSDVNDQSRLFAASRVLEFVTIYAVANLENNALFMENYLYKKSAQHLASAAIKTHQDAWFASRKLKEISRLMRAEKKKSDRLQKKLNTQGRLSAEELSYKKDLDVALMKLGELQQSLTMNLAEYEQMAKVLPKDIKLEGRRFYELEDFDEGYNIDVFQEAAVRNRSEFALAKEKVKNYGVHEVRHDVLRRYPLVKRLDINGLEVEDAVYEQALYDKVISLAHKLLEDVRDMRDSKDGSDEWRRRQRTVFDDLAAAILTQIEVAYQLVEQADADYEANERRIAKVRQAIKTLSKKRRPTAAEKSELLNEQLSLIVLERHSSQIKAERASSLRNLYFYAGLSPFNKTLLRGKIDDISVSLREAFNKDLVEMLSTVSMQMKEHPLMEQTGWARGDNWLEEVVKEGRQSRTNLSRPASMKKDARLLQLGSYERRDSAVADWKQLSTLDAELGQYQPKIEEAFVDGKKWYRLRIYGRPDVLSRLCGKLRQRGQDCLLQ